MQQIQVTVSDDGIGFDQKTNGAEKYGMKNMAQRAKRMNAKLTVESELGNGVKIVVLILSDS